MSDSYQLSAPIYFVGERVGFYDHDVLRFGEIRSVETRYTDEHKGYHTYHIRADGCLRRRLVAEASITGREQEAKSRPGPKRYPPGHPAFVRGIDT